MSKPTVVDTNVILTANRQHEDVSAECVIHCIERLQELMSSRVVVIDDAYRILSEYQHKTSRKGQREVGDIFVTWLLRNSANAALVHCVGLTELPDDHFKEFPDKELALAFDPPNRKFVAVAHGYQHPYAAPQRPKILQATDSKWIDWWEALESCSIDVEFLCREDACRFYRKKFPQKPEPKLPWAIFSLFPILPILRGWAAEPRDDKILSNAEVDTLLSKTVIVEEKVDGANLGFSLDSNGHLLAQNRGNYLGTPYAGQFSK